MDAAGLSTVGPPTLLATPAGSRDMGMAAAPVGGVCTRSRALTSGRACSSMGLIVGHVTVRGFPKSVGTAGRTVGSGGGGGESVEE